jgi:hypothetical protein
MNGPLGYQKGVFNWKRNAKEKIGFFLSSIIIILMDCCMSIDKMMFLKLIKIFKNKFRYYINVILSLVN